MLPTTSSSLPAMPLITSISSLVLPYRATTPSCSLFLCSVRPASILPQPTVKRAVNATYWHGALVLVCAFMSIDVKSPHATFLLFHQVLPARAPPRLLL